MWEDKEVKGFSGTSEQWMHLLSRCTYTIHTPHTQTHTLRARQLWDVGEVRYEGSGGTTTHVHTFSSINVYSRAKLWGMNIANNMAMGFLSMVQRNDDDDDNHKVGFLRVCARVCVCNFVPRRAESKRLQRFVNSLIDLSSNIERCGKVSNLLHNKFEFKRIYSVKFNANKYSLYVPYWFNLDYVINDTSYE